MVLKIVGETVAHRLNDPRVSPLTTVTRVELARDLLTAKVYLSVPGEESVERCSLAGIRSATGFIQRILAGQLSMWHCPALRFEIDDTIRKVRHTMELLAENRRNDPTIEAVDEATDGEEELGREKDAPLDTPEGGEP